MYGLRDPRPSPTRRVRPAEARSRPAIASAVSRQAGYGRVRTKMRGTRLADRHPGRGFTRRRKEGSAMTRMSYGIGVVLLCCAGCTAQQAWRPTVDTFGSSQAQYVSRDMEECRNLALQVSGNSQQAAVQG